MSDIWVVAEHLEGNLAGITFEMLGKAKEMAGASGGKAIAVVIGDGVSSHAGALGAADAVLAIEDSALAGFSPDAHGKALAAAAGEKAPRLVMIANTAMGMDLAGCLAGSQGWPLVAYCNGLSLEGDTLTATSQLYGGKAMADSRLEGASAVVTVLPGSFPEEAGRADGSPAVETVAAAGAGGSRVRFKGLSKPEAGDVDITKEEVLVCVGRGIGGEDDIEVAKELAEALGAQVAASRPVVDNGWLPKTRQVGKSGMTVKPKVYITLGVSGAPEHLEGMSDSGIIIAINTDPSAPIFGVAHYGVVADLFDIVEPLTESIRG